MKVVRTSFPCWAGLATVLALAGSALSAQTIPGVTDRKPTPPPPAAPVPVPNAPTANAGDPGTPVIDLGNFDEPEDGKWLTDPLGRQYFVKSLKKEMVWYKHVDKETIRLRGGPWFKLADEDETTLYLKIYKRGHGGGEERPGHQEPTAEEFAANAAEYKIEAGTVDRLQLVPFDQGLPRVGLWRHGFDLADMNGDGDVDILHGPPRRGGGGPQIFLGNSKGQWRPWNTFQYPGAPYDYGDAAAADFNGDGHMDIALAMHQKGMVAMVGDADGKFVLWSKGLEVEGLNYKGKPALTSQVIEDVDWDGDGDIDILVLAEGPRGLEHISLAGGYGRAVYLNQGDGTWVKYLDDAKVFGQAMALGDFNQDGRPDFVVASSVGGFRDVVAYGTEEGRWRSGDIEVMRRGLIWAVATGDFDGDGRTDVANTYYNTALGIRRAGIDVLLNREDGWRRIPLFVTEKEEHGLVHMLAIGVGDLDGNGAQDLVATSRDGQLYSFLGDGKGGFDREIELALEVPRLDCQGSHIMLHDFDADGRDEIVANFAGEKCPSGGSLRAWQTELRAEPDAAP